MEYNTNGHGANGRSGAWGNARLPSFSGAFGSLMNGHAYSNGNSGGGSADQFFVPSYLRGSKYIQKLGESQRAKAATHKEGHNHSTSGSLSTSASSANLHGKASSHRGVKYEIAENAPPEHEAIPHLPTRWNVHDKHAGIEVLSDGQELKFVGGKAIADRDHEASAIRADHPMPQQCGIYYFEISISHRRREEYAFWLHLCFADDYAQENDVHILTSI